MKRLEGCPAILLLLFLACSSSDGDDFFKHSGDTAGAGGTGSIDVGVGTVGPNTTDGSSATSTSSGGSIDTDSTGDPSGSNNVTSTSAGDTNGSTTSVSTTDSAAATGGSGSGGTGGAPGSGGSGSAGAGGTGGDRGGNGGNGSGGGGGCTPSDEVCDGIDNDCDEDADEGEACPTGCFGDSFEGHAYVFCDRPPGQGGDQRQARNWQQAMQFCLNRGQVLVGIQTSDENDFVYAGLDELDGNGDVWMGATDQDDEALWSWALGMNVMSWEAFYDADEGEPIDDAFVDWRSGEPNDQGGEDCGVIEVQDGDDGYLWDDRSCTSDFDLFVCEDAP